MYARGDGVTLDYQQAWQWFEKGAAAGKAEAMSDLGELYLTGQGTPTDTETATLWLEKGAAAGLGARRPRLDAIPLSFPYFNRNRT